MLPNMLRNPWFLLTISNIAMSNWVTLSTLQKIKIKINETSTLTNIFRLFIAVVFPIFKYSSIKSIVTPYVSIISAAITFWREEN
jgi:hypothetical protein